MRKLNHPEHLWRREKKGFLTWAPAVLLSVVQPASHHLASETEADRRDVPRRGVHRSVAQTRIRRRAKLISRGRFRSAASPESSRQMQHRGVTFRRHRRCGRLRQGDAEKVLQTRPRFQHQLQRRPGQDEPRAKNVRHWSGVNVIKLFAASDAQDK